ncbi:hypothetical protein AB205_0202800 [Aquarana catesbeiana]|uniref:Uncharacterized protein n=1 Tax=Aquarana catesbeiana TaxID=8400 RepID=A0A2G9RDR1_AQUCT|nr:hypothetical protein AB205_0202800 [Aquarana catesbeiana]
MSFVEMVEMVEMVDILKRADYDGKYGPYRNPNVRNAKIMTKVVRSLQKNFGYTLFFIHIGEKRLGTSEDTKNTTPPKGEIPTHPEEEVEGAEVQEVGEIVTTTGDVVDVVEEETHFTRSSSGRS